MTVQKTGATKKDPKQATKPVLAKKAVAKTGATTKAKGKKALKGSK